MYAEKLAMQRRIDKLDQYAVHLQGLLIGAERENAQLKAELEKAKIQNQYISEVADTYEKDIEKLVRERDALKRDLYMRVNGEVRTCHICEFLEQGEETCDREVEMEKCFVWRGLCESNGGKDGKETQSDR